LAALRERVALAAQLAGRQATSVTIVAVSKTHPPSTITAAREAGLTDFGENYVQEAVAKIAAVGAGPTWHFIGGIQANKTKAIAENFRWVQTVSGAHVADRLSRQRPFYSGDLHICLQVQPLPAQDRGGVSAEDLPALAAHVAALPRLKLRGLMFMPLPGLDAAALRAEFRRVRDLFMELRNRGHDLDTLSMGMSEDLEIAVAEGSTMVRVGTALFGTRS
jgi:pyridoxal phosphate enzyme (YggS family)